MRYIVCNFARILGAVAMLSFFAAPLKADPVVGLTPGGAGATNINNLDPFILGTTNAGGMLTVVLSNNTNMTFLDFHVFQQPGFQPLTWTGNGGPFFSNFTSNGQSIDFVIGGTGTGIAPGTTFTITLTGFTAGATIRANATVPEPTTLLLLGTGLAGVAIKARNKFKDGKAG